MTRIETPFERIVRIDHFATVFNSERMLRDHKFLVDLQCGHKTYTGNTRRVRCPRCTEMLRRSIIAGEEDYDSFRKRSAGRSDDLAR